MLYLQGFLTPVIAIVALYVAWQQWKGSELKLRLERYDRRLSVYQEVIGILGLVQQDPAKVNTGDLLRFKTVTAEADFLFGHDIPDYIQDIFSHGLNLWTAHMAYREKPEGYNHAAVVEEMDAGLRWFTQQPTIAREKFLKYLDVGKR